MCSKGGERGGRRVGLKGQMKGGNKVRECVLLMEMSVTDMVCG